MKKLLLLAAMVLGLFTPSLAHAQCPGINCTVPGSGITYIAKNPTYHAVSVGLVPASAATDILCINGSTSKAVHLDQVTVSGLAGTAITVPVVVKLNHSLDTGGTAATGIALPVAAPGNPNDTVSTATLTAYTANPTVNDSTPNLVGAETISLAVTTNVGQPLNLIPGTGVDFFNKSWDITKASTVVQQICLNLNGATIATGSLTIWLEWTEQ